MLLPNVPEEHLPHDSRVMTVPLPQSRLTYSGGEEGHSLSPMVGASMLD